VSPEDIFYFLKKDDMSSNKRLLLTLSCRPIFHGCTGSVCKHLRVF